ncbi:MAG: hypothetical protein ACOY5B_12375 [Spirochaetota bacterium]
MNIQKPFLAGLLFAWGTIFAQAIGELDQLKKEPEETAEASRVTDEAGNPAKKTDANSRAETNSKNAKTPLKPSRAEGTGTKTGTDSQLSAGVIDRDGEWIYEFERQFSVRKERPEFQFLWGFNMLQEFHGYNNGDLRKLDSSNDFQIRTTDDAQGLALTRAKFDTSFMFPKQRVGVEMSFGFDGIWGSFQLQGNGNPGTRIARANIFYEFYRKENMSFDLVLGRQFFSVGGAYNDYMLRDVLDAAVINGHIQNLVDIKILALDVYSGANSFGSGENDRWNDEFQYFSRHESGKQPGLNGDVSTYRTGAVISALPLMKKILGTRLDPRIYGFYARVRGNRGGSDNSENGRIGNYSDSDWSALAGGRVSYRLDDILKGFKQFNVYVDGALSTGADLKRQGEPPADYTTVAFGGGAIAQLKPLLGWLAPLAELDGFFAQGPKYDANGNMTSHGFIGMRGDRVGGTLLRRYWGVRPSGYVGYNGIDDTPFDANRKSGLMVIHAAIGAEIVSKWVAKAEIWHLQDTGSSAVVFTDDNLNLIQNPYKSRAEIEAQKKLGKALGQEINLTVQYFPNELLMFQMTGSLFLPGEFYKDAISDVVTTSGAPKGGPADANFYGVFLRSTLAF